MIHEVAETNIDAIPEGGKCRAENVI